MSYNDKIYKRRRFFTMNRGVFEIYRPISSESRFPLLVIDRKIEMEFFLQIQAPFGLYVRLPFFFARWGSA